MENAATENKT